MQYIYLYIERMILASIVAMKQSLLLFIKSFFKQLFFFAEGGPIWALRCHVAAAPLQEEEHQPQYVLL